MCAARPSGAPQKTRTRLCGEKRRKGAGTIFAVRRKWIEADFALFWAPAQTHLQRSAWEKEAQRNGRTLAARRERGIWSLRHGAPAKAQRSGFCGERSRSGMDELSPRAEAKDMELAATLSRFGLGAWPGRFHSDSGKIQICCADLGFLPSLRSKRPYAPTLRASSRTVPRWSSR